MKKIELVKEKAFYQKFFSVWIVLVVYNVITLGVNLADNIMVGVCGEVALSGVTAVNQIQFLLQQIIIGAGEASVVLGSQYWGQGRPGPIKRFSVGTLLLGAALGILLFLLGTFCPAFLVGLFTDSPQIIEAGVEYLSVIRFSYILFALSNLLLATLRSVETVKIGFWVSVAALVMNISLNFLLIEGHWGAPALGITGAAIATLAARGAELIVVVVYLLFFDKKLLWRVKDLFHPDWVLVKDYLRLARPFVLTSIMFGTSVCMQTVILGRLSDNAIAANSVASTLYQVMKVAAVGAASAASILIGQAIGSGKMNKIRAYSQTLQLMFLGIGLCASTLLFLLRYPVVSLYGDLSDDTRRMAMNFLLILCFTGFGTSYQMPVNTGIIRGGGDAKFVFFNDLINIWCLMIPLSLVAAFVFRWPPEAVILCLNSDQVIKCIPAVIKVNRYHWMKKLTRE